MRYCTRCRISYDSDMKRPCVYCQGPLVIRNVFQVRADEKLVIEDREKLTHERKNYLFGSFFRNQTFLTSFIFCIKDMKEGEPKKRFWVQPINMSYFIKLPWLVINFFYSVGFYLFVTAHCEKCNMKYALVSGEKSHSEDACAYNQEYNRITQELFSGKLLVSLKYLEDEGQERVNQGKRSAYFDLMNRNTSQERVFDVLVILMTFGLYIFLIAMTAMPIFAKIYDF